MILRVIKFNIDRQIVNNCFIICLKLHFQLYTPTGFENTSIFFKQIPEPKDEIGVALMYYFCSVDVQLEQRISKTKLNGATIKLSVTLKYTKLSSVQSIMKKLNSVSTKSPPAKLPSPTEGLDPAIGMLEQ